MKISYPTSNQYASNSGYGSQAPTGSGRALSSHRGSNGAANAMTGGDQRSSRMFTYREGNLQQNNNNHSSYMQHPTTSSAGNDGGLRSRNAPASGMAPSRSDKAMMGMGGGGTSYSTSSMITHNE